MSKIKQAPDGERTSIDGTEALPLSSSDSVSSWWTPISRIAEYIRTLTQTLTGKTINLSNNTLTGTTAQFNTANSDGDFATLAGSETLTNKTLTTPTIASFTNATHIHEGASSGGTLDEDALAFTDVTTNNSSTSKHGLLKKLDNNAFHFMDGQGNWSTPTAGAVSDSDVLFTDITTNNSSISKHGFLPKLSGDSDTFLNGDGEFTTPTVSGSVATDAIWDAKGDLAAGTGANTASRLAVGTTGYVLTADSDEATGIKWAVSSGGSNALLYKSGTRVDVKNDATEQTVLSYSVPGGTLSISNAIKIIIQARIIHSISGTLTVKLKYGATTLLTITVPEGTTTADKSADIWFLLTATGATNTQRASGRIDLQDRVGSPSTTDSHGTTGIYSRWNQEGTAAEDSTASKTLAVTVQWGAASNSLEYDQSWAGVQLLS